MFIFPTVDKLIKINAFHGKSKKLFWDYTKFLPFKSKISTKLVIRLFLLSFSLNDRLISPYLKVLFSRQLSSLRQVY